MTIVCMIILLIILFLSEGLAKNLAQFDNIVFVIYIYAIKYRHIDVLRRFGHLTLTKDA